MGNDDDDDDDDDVEGYSAYAGHQARRHIYDDDDDDSTDDDMSEEDDGPPPPPLSFWFVFGFATRPVKYDRKLYAVLSYTKHLCVASVLAHNRFSVLDQLFWAAACELVDLAF